MLNCYICYVRVYYIIQSGCVNYYLLSLGTQVKKKHQPPAL